MVPNCHSNRKLAILIQSSHFTPTLIDFHGSYKLLLQIEHHNLPIHLVSSSNLEQEKLSKAFTCVKHGGCHDAIHFIYFVIHIREREREIWPN